jgi:hypothetical protein
LLDLPTARVFASQQEAAAYEAAERAKGVTAMEDQCLIALALGGSAEPEFEAIWQELEARAARGSLFCQRGIIRIVTEVWGAGRMGVDGFLDAVEPFARMAARSGEDRDLCELAAVFAVRASSLRHRGEQDEAHALEVEALKLLGRVANESESPVSIVAAAADYQALAQRFPEAADEASCDLLIQSLTGELRDEPEVTALRQTKGEE